MVWTTMRFTSLLQVRNRTQDEIASHLSAAEAAERERQYFAGSLSDTNVPQLPQALRDLPAEKKGKQSLIKLLLRVQGAHMQGSIAPIKKKACGLPQSLDEICQ